jgi:hypothetical protein
MCIILWGGGGGTATIWNTPPHATTATYVVFYSGAVLLAFRLLGVVLGALLVGLLLPVGLATTNTPAVSTTGQPNGQQNGGASCKKYNTMNKQQLYNPQGKACVAAAACKQTCVPSR